MLAHFKKPNPNYYNYIYFYLQAQTFLRPIGYKFKGSRFSSMCPGHRSTSVGRIEYGSGSLRASW